MDYTIIIEKTWVINNPRYRDGLIITKTYLKSDLTGKKIPNSVIYSVDFEEENLNCFKTFKEAKEFARNF